VAPAGRPARVLFFTFAICTFAILSLSCTYQLSGPDKPPNGGFVPDFRKSRSFVINQIGGFVFEKKLSAISFQLSASGHSQFTIQNSHSQFPQGFPYPSNPSTICPTIVPKYRHVVI